MSLSPTPTIKQAFVQLKQKLLASYEQAEATGIAEMVMTKISGLSRSQQICQPELRLSDRQFQQWIQMGNDLLNNRPVQYVLGEVDFFGVSLSVDESVLIPRPETAELVNMTLQELKAIPKSKEEISILDMGTGSGCIALALKKNLPEATVFAAEFSIDALATAKKNALKNHLEVSFLQWNILEEAIPKALFPLDIVISNPPYITFEEKEAMHQNVLNFEPHAALFVTNKDPLQFYKAIESISQKILKPTGKIYLELNEQYAKDTFDYFQHKGWYCQLFKDLQGKDRMMTASRLN